MKSTSYGENVVVLEHVAGLGADEALLANSAGRLCEGITTNVFVALGGVLTTPSRTRDASPGSTREVLLDAGVATEADLPMSVVHEADEVFLTSSLRGVTPVSHVDGRALRTAGALTADAARALADAVSADLATRRR